DRLLVGAVLIMVEHPLGIGVGVALDQHDQRVGAHRAPVSRRHLLDAAAARLLRVEAGAAEESVGAVLGNELEAALRRGGTDDRYRFLHRLRPGLAILEREMLARMG